MQRVSVRQLSSAARADTHCSWYFLVDHLAGIVLAISVSHFSHRAERGDVRDVGLLTLAYRLVRRSGTRFVDADLTDPDFRGVDLNRCDMASATLEGVLWVPGRMVPGGAADNTP